ncbi:MAG TPA: hypothetical protein VJ182_03340, partial [Anaerolineales bacterium]|nr:hypothetical protein [Anaerolineales bacterium]
MVTRIGAWIELSFWQMAVRVLSGVRPLSRGMAQAKTALDAEPLTRFLPNGWAPSHWPKYCPA